MEANPVRIVQYFDGEKQSIIPLFQRPYTWSKRNWQTLWDDIISYYDDGIDSTHFMGAVVSIPAKTVPIGVTKHLVIDGQQRLTTVAILLCALKDCCEEKKSAQILDYLVNRHYGDTGDYLKLLPTQGDREAYLEIIEGKCDPGRKSLITECHDYFKKQIMGNDASGIQIDPERILEIVKNLLQVVMINLGETDDPYLIFESLNFKGEPLSQADLVRNYILMRFRNSLGSGGEQEKIYREIWHPMEQRLGLKIEEFLWHYSIQDGQDVKKPRIYSAMKATFNICKTSNDVIEKLGEMNKDSINYSKFIDPPKESSAKIQKELTLLDKLEATICYPILLRLFRGLDNDRFEESVLTNALKYLNSFILRRAVCDEKRSALNKLFANIVSRFPEDISSIDDWIGVELSKRTRSERWPTDDEFIEAIKNKVLYKTKAGRILLENIEASIAGKEVIDLDNDRITIEHIMPQTLNDDWKRQLGDSYEEIHSRRVDTLGNLTLSGMNSELGNMQFYEKKKIYETSGIALNRGLSHYNAWTETEIIHRSESMAKIAIKIWPRYS